MGTSSAFRGFAGEVVRNSVIPSVWLTLIGVAAYWFLAFLVSLALALVFPPAVLLLYLFTGCYLIGKFALPAAQGHFFVGLYSPSTDFSEVFGFVVRLVVGSLVWAVPAGLLGWQLIRGGSGPSLFEIEALSMLSGGLRGLGLTLVAVVFFLGPSLSVILAVGTDSAGQLLTSTPWLWLYHKRRADLPCFYASLIGGCLVFFAIYLIPVMVLAAVLGKMSPSLGVTVGLLIPSLPGFVAPVMLGRLAGAFVYGEDALDDIGKPIKREVEPSESEQPPSAERAPAVVASEPRIGAPLEDPTQELIEATRGFLAAQPVALAAFLYSVSKADAQPVTVLGIELAPDCPLAMRQSIPRRLGELIKGHIPNLRVQAIGPAVTELVRQSGLKIYVRKS